MWMTFGLAVLLAICAFYLPGWIALKPVGLRNAQALIFAPCVSLCLYVVIVFVCSAAGILMTGTLLLVAAALVAIVAAVVIFVIRRAAKRDAKADAFATSLSVRIKAFLHDQRHLFLYVGFGIALTAFVFVRNLDGPASYVQFSDNIFHMSLVQSYIESGNWSPLASTIYPEQAWSMAASFYPSLFHVVVATVAGILGAPIALAQNAVIFAILAILLPIGMLQFIRVVFPDRQDIQFYGAFSMLGFAAFPWMFLVFGPLYSNLLSLTIAPLALSMFVLLTQPGLPARRRLGWIALFLMSLIAMAVAQTNACFTVGVILVPYCAKVIWDATQHMKRQALRLAAVAGFALLVILMWALAYNLPFLRGVVGFTWPAFSSVSQAPINILFLAYKDSAAQIFLGIILIIGILYVCRIKQARWLIWGYGFFMCAYLVCALTDGALKHILAGFWYTDGYRIAASAVICAIPLAAAGLVWLKEFVRILLVRFSTEQGRSGALRCMSAAIALGVFFLLNYYPNYVMPGSQEIVRTGIGEVAFRLNEYNADSAAIYTQEEADFVEKASAIVSEDAVVANFPFDGSVFAFPVNDMDVAFRKWDSEEMGSSFALRSRLDKLADDAEVRNQLDDLGVKYVLLLDQGKQVAAGAFGYLPQEWAGIEAITDETPGLKVLLAEGDMRLYEIVE